MAEISKFQKYVYKTIEELNSFSPDGELTYSKILTCFLNGTANKNIPWSIIQKSKFYGKFEKANVISVMLACKNLVEEGYLTSVMVGKNYKYYLTDKDMYEERPQNKLFSEKITRYKKYLFQQFRDYLVSYCPFIKAIEHENYVGFINKNPIRMNEYNWIWITNESTRPNSLTVYMRSTPSRKRDISSYILSQESFFEVFEDIIETLKQVRKEYSLKFNTSILEPSIQGPVTTTRAEESKFENNFSDFVDIDKENIFVNDGSEMAVDVSLSVSEISPYKYGGETVFIPKQLQKTVQDKSNFDFSFLRWKIVAWSSDKETKQVRCVLMISKKTKNSWIIVSLSKRKVVCVSKYGFTIQTNERNYTNEEILDVIFK